MSRSPAIVFPFLSYSDAISPVLCPPDQAVVPAYVAIAAIAVLAVPLVQRAWRAPEPSSYLSQKMVPVPLVALITPSQSLHTSPPISPLHQSISAMQGRQPVAIASPRQSREAAPPLRARSSPQVVVAAPQPPVPSVQQKPQPHVPGGSEGGLTLQHLQMMAGHKPLLQELVQMQRTLQWAEHIQCEPPTIPASSDALPAEAEPKPEPAGARGGVQATTPLSMGMRAPTVATEYNHYEVPERDLFSGPLWLLGGGSSIGTPSAGMAGRESAVQRMSSGLACGGRDPRYQQQQAPPAWDIQVRNSLQGQMLLHAALFSSHAFMFSHLPLHTLSIHFIIPF